MEPDDVDDQHYHQAKRLKIPTCPIQSAAPAATSTTSVPQPPPFATHIHTGVGGLTIPSIHAQTSHIATGDEVDSSTESSEFTQDSDPQLSEEDLELDLVCEALLGVDDDEKDTDPNTNEHGGGDFDFLNSPDAPPLFSMIAEV